MWVKLITYQNKSFENITNEFISQTEKREKSTFSNIIIKKATLEEFETFEDLQETLDNNNIDDFEIL